MWIIEKIKKVLTKYFYRDMIRTSKATDFIIVKVLETLIKMR